MENISLALKHRLYRALRALRALRAGMGCEQVKKVLIPIGGTEVPVST